MEPEHMKMRASLHYQGQVGCLALHALIDAMHNECYSFQVKLLLTNRPSGYLHWAPPTCGTRKKTSDLPHACFACCPDALLPLLFSLI